jgi:hypothetical protein
VPAVFGMLQELVDGTRQCPTSLKVFEVAGWHVLAQLRARVFAYLPQPIWKLFNECFKLRSRGKPYNTEFYKWETGELILGAISVCLLQAETSTLFVYKLNCC